MSAITKKLGRGMCALLIFCMLFGLLPLSALAQTPAGRISFHANGGTPALQTADAVLGESYGALFGRIQRPRKVDEANSGPEREVLMQFIGWFTTPSGSGVQVHPGDTVTADSPRVLHARWRGGNIPDCVSMFYGNGGTPVGQHVSTHRVWGATMAEMFALIVEPVRAGHAFVNWARITYSGTGERIATPVLPTEPIVSGFFAAQWQAETSQTVTVTFGAGENGRLVGDTTVEVPRGGSLTAAQVPIPIGLTGYSFAHWTNSQRNFGRWNLSNLVIHEATTFTAVFNRVNMHYDVIFLWNDGRVGVDNVMYIQTVAPGGRAVEPAPPSRPGFTFVRWTRDARGNEPFDFESPLTNWETFLYAQWAPVVVPHPFTDVSTTAWYAGAVQFMYQRDLMQGLSETHFAPAEALTRAQAVLILWRMADSPGVPFRPVFSDVPSNAPAWYRNAVLWAHENDIIQGFEGRFNPYGSITREEFAAILHRYARLIGGDVRVPDTFHLDNFQDREDLSGWAEIYKYWAVYNELFHGTGANTLAPDGTATRAQAATILMRFVQAFAE